MNQKLKGQLIDLKCWFFEKMNKIDKALTILTRRKRSTALVRLEVKRKLLQQNPNKSGESLGSIVELIFQKAEKSGNS